MTSSLRLVNNYSSINSPKNVTRKLNVPPARVQYPAVLPAPRADLRSTTKFSAAVGVPVGSATPLTIYVLSLNGLSKCICGLATSPPMVTIAAIL